MVIAIHKGGPGSVIKSFMLFGLTSILCKLIDTKIRVQFLSVSCRALTALPSSVSLHEERGLFHQTLVPSR